MRSNAGWHIQIQLFIPVEEILVAKGEGETFSSTGFLQTLDPETRRPRPNPMITLVEVVPLRIRLVTPDGETLGPFTVEFDPLAELQQQGKRTLQMTTGSWLAFRDHRSHAPPLSRKKREGSRTAAMPTNAAAPMNMRGSTTGSRGRAPGPGVSVAAAAGGRPRPRRSGRWRRRLRGHSDRSA
jgi:hypothetical protein